ncbi:hypothetical protein JCM10450v2_000685 [Rhodotorula kratochvilovae]
MPPSPPPPAPPAAVPHDRVPTPGFIQADVDLVPEDYLVRLLESAHAAPTPILADPARLDADLDADAPPLASHLDDLAADMLAQRHAARRARELEWDEQDNAARRARALLRSMYGEPPADGDDELFGEDDDGEGEDPDMDDIEHLGGGFGYARNRDDEDEDDGDGDMMDDDASGFSDDLDTFMFNSVDPDAIWRGFAQAQTDVHALLPGYAGERPLNPSHVAPRDTYSAPDPAVPFLSRDPSSALSYTSFLQPGATFVGEQTFGSRERSRSRSRVRLSSSVSAAAPAPRQNPTYARNINAPGPFTADWGERAVHALLTAAENNVDADDVSTAHPAFAPHPSAADAAPAGPSLGSLRTSTQPPWHAAPSSAWEGAFGPSSSLAIPRPPPSGAGAGTRTGTGASPGSGRAENSPLLALLRARSSPSARYAPYSAPGAPPPAPTAAAAPGSVHAPTATYPSTSGAGAAGAAVGSSSTFLGSTPSGPSDAAARVRARVAQSVNPAARSSRGSWGDVGEELLLRAVARERDSEARAGRGGADKRRREGEERWSVKVTIHTYDPELKSLTGTMRAHGVAITPSSLSSPLPPGGAPPRTVSDVTTFFSGSILHPILDGLFSSPSPTGSGGEFRVTRASEAESWVQLGPFKGMSRGELLECGKSRTWVEERTRGWVLFRWKEREFINVTDTESALSISGFYHVVLNRQTGEIEGLYHDPKASPHQRLVLSPADNDRGAFSLGTFAYR